MFLNGIYDCFNEHLLKVALVPPTYVIWHDSSEKKKTNKNKKQKTKTKTGRAILWKIVKDVISSRDHAQINYRHFLLEVASSSSSSSSSSSVIITLSSVLGDGVVFSN